MGNFAQPNQPPTAMKTTTAITVTTCPAATGLALASLAAELLAQGIAAVLAPAIALVLALAGCGHELALAAVAEPAAEPSLAEPSLADFFAAVNREMARSDARLYRSVGEHIATVRQLLDQAEPGEDMAAAAAAAVIARREAQITAYSGLVELPVRALRQLARQAGHSRLARQGRRGELLATLVPA